MINLGKLHHVSVITNDMEASRHFYCNVLGMKEVERPPTFDFEGQWFRKQDSEIHTIYREESWQAAGDPQNENTLDRDITYARHFCFGVSSIADAVKTLAENDVAVIAGPRPRGDGATQLYVYDPDGHMIELVYEPWAWDEEAARGNRES